MRLGLARIFSEYRNLRIPLMLLPTIFNRVCMSLEGRTECE
ncbi:hypothetical protein HMPREF0208_01984 [Citrobacter koseri]|nr:hypothetical protein HMPREF3220_03559 [Citrobacter koseri]KXA00621.1 hypothetical protein HMPREF3207_03277 [Citrobacter koseri]KXB44242.1 hypothetical protein HMPREF0208_01984 [Citrobacter koseri]DAK07638.1 MAG TPA: hypothetical protein [Caudoviricetes sp.]